MKTTDKTILITGGGSGIGFETARLLAANGNQVIITGRDRSRLERAATAIGNVHFIPCDITSAQQVQELVASVLFDYGKLDVLVNNAAQANVYELASGTPAFGNAQAEMLTNYLSVIRLTDLFLPVLMQQDEAAIVNVSSLLAYAPTGLLPGYSASKAALHSYTQVLRLALAQRSAVRVFEVMPPIVDTEFSRAIPAEHKMPPSEVAEAILHGMENDQYEIRVGQTEEFYQFFLGSPEQALLSLNQVAVG